MSIAVLVGVATASYDYDFHGTALHYRLDPPFEDMTDVIISVAISSRTNEFETAMFPCHANGEPDGDAMGRRILDHSIGAIEVAFPNIPGNSHQALLEYLGYGVVGGE